MLDLYLHPNSIIVNIFFLQPLVDSYLDYDSDDSFDSDDEILSEDEDDDDDNDTNKKTQRPTSL